MSRARRLFDGKSCFVSRDPIIFDSLIQKVEEVDQVIGRVCAPAFGSERDINEILYFMSNSPPMVLTQIQIKPIMDALRDCKADGPILWFIEHVLSYGESFNTEGFCTNEYVEIMFRHFPNEMAVRIMRVFVGESEDLARLVFSFHSSMNFLKFLAPESPNLPSLIYLLSGFIEYNDVRSINEFVRQAVETVLGLAVEHEDLEVKCEAFRFLRHAAAQSEFAKIIGSSVICVRAFVVTTMDESVLLRLKLLKALIKSLPKPDQFLMDDHEGVLMAFIESCCRIENNDIRCLCADVSGRIAELGDIFTGALIAKEVDNVLFFMIHNPASVSMLSKAVVGICRFMIWSPSVKRAEFVTQGLPGCLAAVLGSMTDRESEGLVACLLRVVDVCINTGDDSVKVFLQDGEFRLAMEGLYNETNSTVIRAGLCKLAKCSDPRSG